MELGNKKNSAGKAKVNHEMLMNDTRRVPVLGELIDQIRFTGGASLSEQYKNELSIANQLNGGPINNGTSNPHMDMLLGVDEKITGFLDKL